ncbi:MAG: SUMF1/EgtB/PvdO family nonheme iron enzyme [Myxococcota bacterium]
MRPQLVLATLVSTAAFAASPVWHAVPSSTVVFGCSDEGAPTEKRPAPTRVPALWLTARITAAEYQQCVASGACKAVPSRPWCNTTAPTWPATCVSFPEAARYCAWAGGRLPTAVEWESFADSGFDLNAGEGVDAAHGASEWVVGNGREAGYEEVRGGVPDLAPLRRCEWGNARRDLEAGNLGFRCVRASPPPPLPRHPDDVKRTLRGFSLVGGRVVLSAMLGDDELARTFVACKTRVAPLGARLSSSTEDTAWGPVTRHAYATPCQDVVFVLTAPDVQVGPLRPPGRGLRSARFEGCRASHGAQVVEVPGRPERCQVRLAGDFNDDGLTDFFVETRDVCTGGVLLLSSGDSWLVAARDESPSGS